MELIKTDQKKYCLIHGKEINHPKGSLLNNRINKVLNNVEKVRQGKFFEIDVIETDEKKAKDKAEEICKKLLANLVIEDYKIIVSSNNS